MAFIKQYFTEAIDVLYGNDYEKIKTYFDVETFASTYIIHELYKSVDTGVTSFYLYKDSGGKICCGPIWDFDVATGNCDHNDPPTHPENLYARERNLFYNRMLSFADFKTLVASKIGSYYQKVQDELLECTNYALNHQDDFARNYNKWQTIGVYVWPNPTYIVELKTWEDNIKFLNNWIDESMKSIVKEYSPSTVIDYHSLK